MPFEYGIDSKLDWPRSKEVVLHLLFPEKKCCQSDPRLDLRYLCIMSGKQVLPVVVAFAVGFGCGFANY